MIKYNRLRKILQEKEIRGLDFAKQVGVNQNQVYKIQANKGQLTISRLFEWAEALNVEARDLLVDMETWRKSKEKNSKPS